MTCFCEHKMLSHLCINMNKLACSIVKETQDLITIPKSVTTKHFNQMQNTVDGWFCSNVNKYIATKPAIKLTVFCIFIFPQIERFDQRWSKPDLTAGFRSGHGRYFQEKHPKPLT